ncbi:MAG: hypothetical protein R3C44_13365 [Chloroflexota bacterium]
MSGKKPSPPNSEQLYRQQAQAVLQQIALAADQTVLIARGPQVLVHRGDLKPTEAQDIAAQVAEGGRNAVRLLESSLCVYRYWLMSACSIPNRLTTIYF